MVAALGAIVFFSSKTKILITEAGIIYWMLGLTSLFFLSSSIILILVFLNEHRRLGRQEVRHLLGRCSIYGSPLGAKRCADEIINAMTTGDFVKLAQMPIQHFVIDHYVDYGFNVKLYRYMDAKISELKMTISNDQMDGVVNSIREWKSQCIEVEKFLRECV